MHQRAALERYCRKANWSSAAPKMVAGVLRAFGDFSQAPVAIVGRSPACMHAHMHVVIS